MKKFFLIFAIILLVLTTSIIKNSSKKIEDEIFVIRENIRSLNIQLEESLLEYNYLSSPEKLLNYQLKYFDDELVQKDILEIKKMIKKNGKFIEKNFIEK